MASTILLFALQRERKRTLHRERISYGFSSGVWKQRGRVTNILFFCINLLCKQREHTNI